jgi:hypothetical protein
MSDISALESRLRRQLQGKTLLGEVAFEERHCEQSAQGFKQVFSRYGFSDGLARVQFDCPILFAMWLVNEAFYSYDSGYWPAVTAKVGVNPQNNAARMGAAFVDILDRFRLPRFRRLNTHWSYLGPILAHCGVPKSRLPQFFDEVLPLAARIGVGSAEGLAELQQQLASLRVSRSIEWFIRFGDTVSADFVRRCLDMYNVAHARNALPPSAAFGVPERVWKEFEKWTRTAHIQVPGASPPRLLRPRLYVDPSQGLRLELPAQPCHHASLDWDIRIDAESPIVRTVPRFAGEGHSGPDDVLLGAPFASAMVRLKEPGGRELGTWVLAGLPTDRPVMFFDCEDFSVLPGEASAAAHGVLVPTGYLLRVRRGDGLHSPPVLSPLGRLPFGWGAFEASICDFTGGSAVILVDEAGRTCGEIELGEGEAAAPRLLGETVSHLAASDRTRVFVGSAPTVLIPAVRQAFDEQWTIVIDPACEHCNGTLPRIAPESASLFTEPSVGEANQLAVPLDQPNLLGTDPWGVFDILVKGPLGQSARFRIAVVPPLRIEHDWSEWRQGTAIHTTVHTHAEVATATAIVRDRVLLVERERTPLRLKCDGYGRQRWSIPVDLHLPIPSWSVQDGVSSAHLMTWSSQPSRLTLAEADGLSPQLMVRTATPWGVPRSATLQLRHNERVLFSASVPLDANGYGKFDLQPLLANARQAGYPRVHARLDLQLARTVSLDCLTIERHWTVDGVGVAAEGDRVHVFWTERFPMQGRVLRVHSRLTPWESPRSVHIDASARGLWEGPISEVVAEPGRYRFELGVEDEWTGTFTSAGSCEWDHGTLEEWRSRPLYGEPSVDGALYHYLVNAAAGTVDTNTLYIGTDERGEELSTKLFLALQAMGHERAGASKRLERLLSRVWLWPLLRGLVASATSLDPSTLLELGVLAQARVGADRPGLSEHQADQLWRLWPPLGAWADLQALTAGVDRAAEARFVRWMGTDALRQMGPVATGSRLCFRNSDRGLLRQAQLLEVVGDGAVSPFDYHALREVLTLRVLFDGEKAPRDIEVINGVWSDIPDREFAVEVRYPGAVSACCTHPEQIIVQLVKRGLGHILKGQEAHCKPFPTSPIGQEAFQAAGFEWAIAAAEQPGRRDDLNKACREVAALVRDVRNSDDGSPDKLSFERLRAELKARAHPLADDDPLLAVHQASWLVASTPVWRSLGRHFVACPPHQLVWLATTLYDLAPRLFAHDLMKVCAIEALLAVKAPDAARPNEAHE